MAEVNEELRDLERMLDKIRCQQEKIETLQREIAGYEIEIDFLKAKLAIDEACLADVKAIISRP